MKNRAQANKGMAFEREIELANTQYRLKGVALINKVPTPWKVIRGHNGKIQNAFPEQKSICDFIGMYDGRAVAFEAKETKNKTSFPLSRIEPHQFVFLKKWHKHGGNAFVLIRFSEQCEVFNIPFEALDEFQERAINGGRKSITYDELKPFKVQYKDGMLDYFGAAT